MEDISTKRFRSPGGPARELLKVVDHDPNAVIHTINDGRSLKQK